VDYPTIDGSKLIVFYIPPSQLIPARDFIYHLISIDGIPFVKPAGSCADDEGEWGGDRVFENYRST
jgi:hypothetical protein